MKGFPETEVLMIRLINLLADIIDLRELPGLDLRIRKAMIGIAQELE